MFFIYFLSLSTNEHAILGKLRWFDAIAGIATITTGKDGYAVFVLRAFYHQFARGPPW